MGVRDLSRVNRERILRQIWQSGPLTRIALSQQTQLAPATVNRLTASLLESGLIIPAGSDSTTGGRPSLRVQFNTRAGAIVALDAADYHTDVAYVDLAGTIISTTRVASLEMSPDQRRAQLIERAQAAVEASPVPVVAVGVSIPGPVAADGTVTFAPSLGWHDVPLRSELEAALGLPVRVENDANLIATAEYVYGAGRGAESLVTIAVFNGIGSGIIENGRLWRGASGAAGQIGRMLIDIESLDRAYAGFGDFETRMGARGLVKRAAELGIVDRDATPLAVSSLFERFASGDGRVEEFMHSVFDEFAVTIINLCALLAPQVITFAGLFDRWQDVVLPALAERIRPHVIHMPRLAAVATGEQGALLGAARYAFESTGSIEGLLYQSVS